MVFSGASNANIPVVCIPDLKVPSEEIAKTAAIAPMPQL